MFGMTKKANLAKEEIKRIYEEAKNLVPGSEEHSRAMEAIEKIRGQKRRIDWTPIIVAGVGLVQVILILKHEELRVIASKALNFVVRGRA
jgi:hypothetical protein